MGLRQTPDDLFHKRASEKRLRKHGSSVQADIRRFYEREGWTVDANNTFVDTRKWGSTVPSHVDYARRTVMDIKTLFQGEGEIFLNCGCGPYTDTALEISAGYRRNACVDISERALEICRHKLGPKGLYLCGSMVGLALPEGISDGTLCEHVLYHVDKFEQERAVRELIRVTKPGAPILIIYSNPLSPLNVIENTLRLMGITKLLGGNRLYFFRWRLKWWRRFGDVCDVEIRPFDPISARQENILLRSDNVARIFFRFCRWLEAEWPHLAVRIWSYPMIVLTKRPYASRSNEDRIEVDAKVDLQG